MERIQYPIFAIQQASGEPALSSVNFGATDGMAEPCLVLFEEADAARAVAHQTNLQEFTLQSIPDQPELVKCLLSAIGAGVYHAYLRAKQDSDSRVFPLLDILSAP